MKTTILKMFSLLAFIALFAAPAEVNAQITSCPYKIANATGCTITIDYMLYSNGNPCTAMSAIVIAPGTSYVIPCSDMFACGPPQWDVDVTITDYAGFPVSSPQTVNSSNAGPLSWGPCATGVSAFCCANTSFQITWTSSSTIIQ